MDRRTDGWMKVGGRWVDREVDDGLMDRWTDRCTENIWRWGGRMERWVKDGEDRQMDRRREAVAMGSWMVVGQMDGMDRVVMGRGQMDR